MSPDGPVQVLPYPGDGAARDRFEREGAGFVETHEPRETCVVLGRMTPVTDVNAGACMADGVAVYRRAGGGGAVVLAPGMLVITLCFPIKTLPDVSALTSDIAGVAASSLDALALRRGAVAVQGLGDVCISGRKVLGSSLYLRRRMGLYQASLLVAESRDVICRYLFHPSREPEYRAGRPHSLFVTSLEEHGFPVDPGVIESRLCAGFRDWLTQPADSH
ncbi:MAG: biotin/lipoate A/B protein ligase family protein [Ignavibacteriales bacterium]